MHLWLEKSGPNCVAGGCEAQRHLSLVRATRSMKTNYPQREKSRCEATSPPDRDVGIGKRGVGYEISGGFRKHDATANNEDNQSDAEP